MKIKKIVLIDDNKFIETLLISEFKEIIFYHATNSSDGIQTAKNYGADLFIISRILEKETGFDAADKIRHDIDVQNLPIIMISSSDEEEVINKAYKCGINSFIDKTDIFDNLQRVLGLFEEFGFQTFHTNILLFSTNKNCYYAYKSRLNQLGICIEFVNDYSNLRIHKYDFIIIDDENCPLEYSELSNYLIFPGKSNVLALIDRFTADKEKQKFQNLGYKEFYIKPFVFDIFIKDLLTRLANKENTVADKTILLVDDSQIFRIQMSSIISGMGIKVRTAQNVDEAFAILKKSAIDLIVTDLYMPNIDGEKFIQMLKNSPLYKNIPIIVLSSADKKTKIISCFELGAADFINKPINIEEVIARVKRLLNYK